MTEDLTVEICQEISLSFILKLMNQFAGQKLRHSCREQTYGHQRGKRRGGGEGRDELGDWD